MQQVSNSARRCLLVCAQSIRQTPTGLGAVRTALVNAGSAFLLMPPLRNPITDRSNGGLNLRPVRKVRDYRGFSILTDPYADASVLIRRYCPQRVAELNAEHSSLVLGHRNTVAIISQYGCSNGVEVLKDLLFGCHNITR
jgi:hypothetical protein